MHYSHPMARLRASIVLAVLALAPLTPTQAFAGACAMPQIPTTPLTAVGTEIAKGGGVVVSMEDAAKAPRLEFSSGAKRVRGKVRAIGAGLAVYEPPATGTWTLLDGKRKELVTVKRATVDGKPLDAPKVASIKYASYTGRRGTSVNLNVEITGAAPAGAIALIVFDDKGAVRSWGAATGGPPDPASKTSSIQVFRSGSCVANPNGTLGSGIGDKVSLAWLDASGRLSAMTSAKVVEQPPPPGTKTGPGPGGD
jgi:hypothetical protein